MRILTTEWEKIFAKGMSNERALFQMYEEILKFNKKKMKNLIREWSKVLKRHFIKEDMQMTITI